MEQPVFYELDSNEQVILAALIALLLSNGLNANQLNILGNFVEAVGQNMLLIQAVVSSSTQQSDTSGCNCAEVQDALAVFLEKLAVLEGKVATLEQR